MPHSPRHPLALMVCAPFRLLGLTGPDGWPSFSKFITVAVVASYIPGGQPIPEMVAIAVIVSAHGGKWVSEYIQARFGGRSTLITNESGA